MLLRNSKPLILLSVLVGFWICSSATLWSQSAVMLQLRNGDRLTGKVLSENTNEVVISTTWAKEIAVPLSEISRRDILPQTVVTNITTDTVATTTNTLTNTVAKLETPKLSGTNTTAPQNWHGEIHVGMDLGFNEKNRQLYYGTSKLTYAHEIAPHRFLKNTFDFSATYGRTDGITSANQAGVSDKTDYDLTKRIYVYNLMGAGFDEVRKINFQYEVGPGVGYHILMWTNYVLNAELGFNYQMQDLQGQSPLQRYFYRLAQDSKWTITSKLNFDEKFEFFPRNDFQQYRIRFESNAHYNFFQKYTFSLTLLDIYDTQTASGVVPNDLQIRSSLGLKF